MLPPVAALYAPAPPATPATYTGIVKSMVAGDLMCYVTLDVNRKRVEVGASFELCERRSAFVGRRVQLEFRPATVSDCHSAEPCGKSRRIMLVTAMHVLPPRRP